MLATEKSLCGMLTSLRPASMVRTSAIFLVIVWLKIQDPERRSKDHIRSINAIAVSHVVHHYCITGSADGDMRVWVSVSPLHQLVSAQRFSGPSRHVTITDTCPPPNVCAQPRILAYYMATPPCHRRP